MVASELASLFFCCFSKFLKLFADKMYQTNSPGDQIFLYISGIRCNLDSKDGYFFSPLSIVPQTSSRMERWPFSTLYFYHDYYQGSQITTSYSGGSVIGIKINQTCTEITNSFNTGCQATLKWSVFGYYWLGSNSNKRSCDERQFILNHPVSASWVLWAVSVFWII